jgi:hypothetical protein
VWCWWLSSCVPSRLHAAISIIMIEWSHESRTSFNLNHILFGFAMVKVKPSRMDGELRKIHNNNKTRHRPKEIGVYE